MAELIAPLAGWSATLIELLGICTITLAALYGLFLASAQLFKKKDSTEILQELRQRLGQGILLGLEFLVAADIIKTVALELTLESVGLLAIIVLIRTFLSFTMDVELTGRWPWQERK